MKKTLSLLLVSSSLFSMQLDIVKTPQFQQRLSQYNNSNNVNKVCIEPSSVFVSSKLGSVELYHGEKGFSVIHDDKKNCIQKCFIDPMIRNIKKEELKAFLIAGYLSLNQNNNGEFSLKANGRINGGGPNAGIIAYWVTKCLCWGIVSAATIGAVLGGGAVTVGSISSDSNPNYGDFRSDFIEEKITDGIVYMADNAVIPISSYTGGATMIVTEETARMTSTAPMAVGSVGIGVVATGIACAGLVPEAQAATALGIAEASGGLGVAASIEALSIKVGIFFGLSPLP